MKDFIFLCFIKKYWLLQNWMFEEKIWISFIIIASVEKNKFRLHTNLFLRDNPLGPLNNQSL